MSVTYGGRITEIIPEKASYAQGQIVRVKLKYWAERANGGPAGWTWHSRYQLLVGGQIVAEDPVYHLSSGFETSDHEEVTTKFYSLVAMPAHDLKVEARLLCGG